MKSIPVRIQNPLPAKQDLHNTSHPIVAIGASSGGLEAITQLLQNLPGKSSMSFVYVQHLSPDHKSILVSLLSKTTLMKVQEAKSRMRMKPNHLYVMPPDKEMILQNGYIKLTPRGKERTVNLPINTFFRSLAEAHKELAIGIILSGNGVDGTSGIKAIKQEGGITFAQDSSAKFSSMPDSAIGEGLIDFVLSPKEIAIKLTRLGNDALLNSSIIKSPKEDIFDVNSHHLQIILSLLRKATGVDFCDYKMTTVKRRIHRRMLIYNIKTLAEYIRKLNTAKHETDLLFQDLLINVTSFFRDTDAQVYLKKTLLPLLLKRKFNGETLRIWVPACSSGEEAYSIAMTMLEVIGSKPCRTAIQIFATDLSAEAIVRARLGEYSKQDIEKISPKRLQLFFTRSGRNYRIREDVRDMCVFATHNVLHDPPLSHLDFISCCNLFIYLDKPAQKRVLDIFHYALNDDGYLMMGESENIGTSAQRFVAVNHKLKIFVRKALSGVRASASAANRLSHSTADGGSPHTDKPQGFHPLLHKPPVSIPGLEIVMDTILVAESLSASVVINHAKQILQHKGAMELYLVSTPGEASMYILEMARPEIAFELRDSISEAIKTQNRVRKSGIKMKVKGRACRITLEAIPLHIARDQPLVLIHFAKQEISENRSFQGNGISHHSDSKDSQMKKLEEDLVAIRAQMNAYVLSQKAITEELQSANEEIVSSNEELAAVNEELSNSKAQIESTNEELINTNQELKMHNDLLHESYEYGEAIITTIHEPLIILNKDLRVKSANQSFYKKFHVKQADTEGVLLYDLGDKQWDIPALRELLENIIPKNSFFNNFELTHVFPGIGEKIMLLNASRIEQKIHREQLILLAIHDVTEVKAKSRALQIKEKALHNKEIRESKTEKQSLEKAVKERTKQLKKANKELVFQNKEKEKRAAELIIANKELAFQYAEKENRAAELIIANKELVFQNTEKEKRAAELIIANEELVFQNKEKEKRAAELIIINTELEAFAYVSSHDLQEPLRKIQTFVSRIIEIENKNLSARGKDYFRRMQESAIRMQTLIEDLLAFSRVNTADREFEYLDLNIIIDEVKRDLKDVIDDKQATVEAIELCHASIIPFQFRQLMYNLISNALKFSIPKRPPRITIKCSIAKGSHLINEDLLPESHYCHISVSDNGIGFEHEFSERIFKVFQRLHGREEYDGTGIGLAIVKKIVDNHQGCITATSELNQGATFDIYIPSH